MFVVTLSTTAGFVTTQVGDAIASRGVTAGERTRLEEEIGRLKAARQEMRFIPATEESIVSARAAVTAASTAREGECRRRGDLCRAREADESARLTELTSAIRNKAVTDQSAVLEVELRNAQIRESQ